VQRVWLHAWRAAAGTTDSKRWETNSSPRLCSFWAVVALAQQGRQAAGVGVAAAAVCAAGRHNMQARGSPQVMVAQVAASRRKAELRIRCRLLSGRVGGRGLRSGQEGTVQAPLPPAACEVHACNCKQDWWPRTFSAVCTAGRTFLRWGRAPFPPSSLAVSAPIATVWGAGAGVAAPVLP
jgi:hypothetical protein